MAEDQLQEMSFWDHIDALRSVLIRIVVVLVVATIGLFCVMPYLFDNVILAPCHGDFVLYRLFEHMTSAISWLPQFTTADFHVELINIKLASQFFIHMSSSFWLGLVLTFPIMLYLLWTFVAPALYPRERHGVKTAFVIGCLMFLMGIIFELPLLAWLLGSLGVLHRSFFHTYRRHAVVALLALAAIITPTGDPFTLMVVFLPIYLLYELSAYLVPKEISEPIA